MKIQSEGFNADLIMGKPLKQARNIARGHGYSIRLVKIGDTRLKKKPGFVENRLNVCTDSNRVITWVCSVG
jgi:hypothetical protein